MESSKIKFATIKLINGVKHLSEGMANNLRNLVCYDLNIEQSQENFNIINEAIECYFKASNSLIYKQITMKLYTIEDLKNGMCAVKNDGTVGELTRVLKLAFPKDIKIPKESFKYYYAGKILKDCFIYSDTTSMYKQSVKDFLQPKMYTIEEIKSSKVAILVESEKDADYLRSIDCYGFLQPNEINYYALPSSKSWSRFLKEDYIIININQIIKPNMEKAQDILGYKLIKLEYLKAVEQILGHPYICDKNEKYDFTLNNIKNKLKEASVLDIWFEPVYKTKEKIYTLGIDEKFEIVVRDKKAFYKDEDVTQDLLDFKQFCKKNSFIQFKGTTYYWYFSDTVIKEVGCIKKYSYSSQWLAIDLT